MPNGIETLSFVTIVRAIHVLKGHESVNGNKRFVEPWESKGKCEGNIGQKGLENKKEQKQ